MPHDNSASHPLWQYVFGNPRPVEVEIGCGTGTFILHAAAENPATNYYGIERAYRRARRLVADVDKRGLDNTRILAADAGCVVVNVIPDDSVHAYHIYFPDPWWKRRHFGRRYFTPEFASGLQRTLMPGGTLYLATDVEEVMERMLAAVTAGTTLVRHPERRSPRRGMTNFERKGLLRGADIHDAVFVRNR
jgi:tRNA (guanine-N7-)-methyltransferase